MHAIEIGEKHFHTFITSSYCNARSLFFSNIQRFELQLQIWKRYDI